MFYMIFICLVSSVTIYSATGDERSAIILNTLNHNSCTSASDCSGSQQERIYALPSAYGQPDSDLYDRLSDEDLLVLKSRDIGYWRATDQDTLRQVLFIHRHGDRTPISFPSKDNIANESFWHLHGLGQLTNRGKARLHVLGKIVRQRYDKFLQGSVNKNNRKSRASGSLRCIESAQVFLSSFLTLTNPNSPDAQALIWDQQDDKLSHIWQPASINTLAAKYDGLLNEGANCKNAEAEYASLDNSEKNRQLMEEYKYEREVLEKETGLVIDHFYKWFWASGLLEVERSYFPSKFKPALLAIYDRVQQAGNEALVLFQSNQKLRRIRVGLLIDDMIKNMVDFSKSSSLLFNKKFVHYSAHDINLLFLLGVFENIDNFPYRPDYASNIIIELHEDGEWFVKLFYMPKVTSKLFELHIEGCEQSHKKKRCTLNKFSELMQPYRVSSWLKWMEECDNALDSVDPYDQNP